MKIRRVVNFSSPSSLLRALGGIGLAVAVLVACGSSTNRNTFDDTDGGSSGGFGGDSGGLGDGGSTQIGGRDPVTCEEAQQFKTYVGCDYYPTVTANIVDPLFDFAVAVANVGSADATIKITGNGVNQTLKVSAGSLGKAFLPWVTALKGAATPSTTSGVVKGGAYHLVSDVPVVVYQFNPLEFEGVGGPPGKDWSDCIPMGSTPNCYSYTNDASLLLPSTAMTGNYRIMGYQDMTRNGSALVPPFFAVTGTQDGTSVSVKLPANGQVVGGSGVSAVAGGGTVTFTLDAGDVAQIMGGVGAKFDFSGALLKADKPVQVITGVACVDVPMNVIACDHVEETVFPVETLGKHYVVTKPSTPVVAVGQVVHLYGNVDATTLTWSPSKPSGCPDFLNAGETSDCGEVSDDFEVTGDHEFGLATFMVGGAEVDPSHPASPQGDPSQSFAVAVEQYRKTYVFLAPPDYKTNYVDIVAPGGTTLTLDGSNVSSKLSPISGSQFSAAHVQLDNSGDGSHTLEASNPVGIQVLGYGDNTTFQYPGGLNLSAISGVPVK